jgi:hypothetical protein
VGPVRRGGEPLAAGRLLPALAVLEDVLAAGACELSA